MRQFWKSHPDSLKNKNEWDRKNRLKNPRLVAAGKARCYLAKIDIYRAKNRENHWKRHYGPLAEIFKLLYETKKEIRRRTV